MEFFQKKVGLETIDEYLQPVSVVVMALFIWSHMGFRSFILGPNDLKMLKAARPLSR